MQGDCVTCGILSPHFNQQTQVIWDDKSGVYPSLGQTYHCGLQGRFDLTILDLGPTGISHPATRSLAHICTSLKLFSTFSGVQNVASLPSLASGGAASGALDLTSAVNAITTMDTTLPIPSCEGCHQAILENLSENAQMPIGHRPGVALKELRWNGDHTGDGEIRTEEQAV